MTYYCRRCHEPLEFHDDIDQESWNDEGGWYRCKNGHAFWSTEIEYEGDDDLDDDLDDDDDDYRGDLLFGQSEYGDIDVVP